MKIPRISALVTVLLLASCTATTPIKQFPRLIWIDLWVNGM
ncbi:MAG: hypothetical protein CM15mP51_21920 [Porticoccaceae bacterium]|nr:MAG: hypothetical protein CM15mP51_21920 [Porticoccaceae bacterium]